MKRDIFLPCSRPIKGYQPVVYTNGAFVKYAAVELAAKGIRCNAVSPGMVNTPLIDKQVYSEEDKSKDMSLYPLKRYRKPEEIAFAIIYLLSNASAWVTGTNLVIDGGRSLK